VSTLTRARPLDHRLLAAPRPAIRLTHVWVVLTLVGAFIGPSSSPIGLPDIWWTLRSGAWMLEHGALLTTNPFTSAPTVDPIYNLQWLAQLAFAGLERLGGMPLVAVGNAAAVTLAYGLVVAAAAATSGRVRLACVAAMLAYALGISNLAPRPQTLALPLFACFVLVLWHVEGRATTPSKAARWLCTLPPVMVIWANVHGSFVLGFVVLGCAAAGRLISTRDLRAALPYLAALAVCVVAACINPHGPGAVLYVAGIGGNVIIRDLVTEWAPTTVTMLEGQLFFASWLLLGGLVLRGRGRLTAVEVLLLLSFSWLALSSVRSVVWWGFIVAPITARLVGSLLPPAAPPRRERAVLNGAVLSVVVMLGAVSLPWIKDALPVLPAEKRGTVLADNPERAASFLRGQTFSGRLLAYERWGGYLDWAVWPRHLSFVDGRYELHPTQVWLDYMDIVHPSAHWRALLERYDIGCMLLSQSQQGGLIALVRNEPGWRSVYEDDQAIVFVRS
jgi:hypothetical protein